MERRMRWLQLEWMEVGSRYMLEGLKKRVSLFFETL
jgi:hypothetical protein